MVVGGDFCLAKSCWSISWWEIEQSNHLLKKNSCFRICIGNNWSHLSSGSITVGAFFTGWHFLLVWLIKIKSVWTFFLYEVFYVNCGWAFPQWWEALLWRIFYTSVMISNRQWPLDIMNLNSEFWSTVNDYSCKYQLIFVCSSWLQNMLNNYWGSWKKCWAGSASENG